jgi:hypothetical protein
MSRKLPKFRLLIMALAFSFSSQRAVTAPSTGVPDAGLVNGGEAADYGAEMAASAPQALDPAFQVMAMAPSAPALNSAAPEITPAHVAAATTPPVLAFAPPAPAGFAFAPYGTPSEARSLPVQPRRMPEPPAPEPAPIHTTELLGSAMQRETGAVSPEVLEDLSEQLEQLRNDFFSAVTTISALSDRIERLEQRQHGPGTPSPEISELRTDVQNWITHHMDAAVEQRMRLIWERCQAASPQPPQG